MRTIAHPFVTSDDSDLDLLDRCYETACEALHSEYNIEIPSLDGLMIIPLTNALLIVRGRPTRRTRPELHTRFREVSSRRRISKLGALRRSGKRPYSELGRRAMGASGGTPMSRWMATVMALSGTDIRTCSL